jgi:hypothetical protein
MQKVLNTNSENEDIFRNWTLVVKELEVSKVSIIIIIFLENWLIRPRRPIAFVYAEQHPRNNSSFQENRKVHKNDNVRR